MSLQRSIGSVIKISGRATLTVLREVALVTVVEGEATNVKAINAKDTVVGVAMEEAVKQLSKTIPTSTKTITGVAGMEVVETLPLLTIRL